MNKLMNKEEWIKVDILYGYKELKSFYKPEGNGLRFYSYSVSYDRDGNELSQTEPEPYGWIGYE